MEALYFVALPAQDHTLEAKRHVLASAEAKGGVIRMLESISPYALLCASRPKPAPTIVTAYDLYSQAQQRREQSSETPAPAAAQVADAPAEPSSPRPLSTVPVRRTHYIADIQSRHSAALRRTPMQNHPLT